MLKSLLILFSNHIIYAHTPNFLHTILFTTADLQQSLNVLSPYTFVEDFPGHPSGKEPACQCNTGNIRDVGLIPGLGRSPGEGNGYPFQYSCLKNPMDRGAWWAIVHGVAKSQTRLKGLSTHVCCCSKASSSLLLTTSLLYYLPSKLFFTVNIYEVSAGFCPVRSPTNSRKYSKN